jgi:hypothetical protein
MFSASMTDRIGDFLVRIGAMTPDQVQTVLRAQESGDSRRFGEIAVGLRYINDDSIKRYIDYLEKQRGDRDCLPPSAGRDNSMPNYTRAWERLYLSLRCLAGTGTIRERLLRAWKSGIYKIADHSYDKRISAELVAIREALTAVIDSETGKGSVASTIAQMSEDEACRWSMKIVDLAIDITRLSAIESAGSG